LVGSWVVHINFMEDINYDDENEFFHAEIPDNFKDTRACLRCSLIKTFQQVFIPDFEIIPCILAINFHISFTTMVVRIVIS